MTDKVILVQVEGTTSIHIDAEITAEGDLLCSGQDLGQASSQRWGQSEFSAAVGNAGYKII